MRHQQNKKKTAWKKSRTFGDIKGGRMRIKLKDVWSVEKIIIPILIMANSTQLKSC